MVAVALVLAEGFEEMEAVAVIDILRRADISLTTYSLGQKLVRGSHGIFLEADASLEEVLGKEFELVVLPGGPGVERLKQDDRVRALLERQFSANKFVGAICAAPTVLLEFGMLRGHTVTGYPGTSEALIKGGANFVDGKVFVDDKLITSRGPGTAVEFALELVTALKGPAKSEAVREKLAI